MLQLHSPLFLFCDWSLSYHKGLGQRDGSVSRGLSLLRQAPLVGIHGCSWCICIHLASLVWSLYRTKDGWPWQHWISRTMSSCQIDSSSNIHSVCVCLCHHSMSQQCHGTRIHWVEVSAIKMYEGMSVPLCLLSQSFFLAVRLRHNLSAVYLNGEYRRSESEDRELHWSESWCTLQKYFYKQKYFCKTM